MRGRLAGIITGVLVGVVGVPLMATAAPIELAHNDVDVTEVVDLCGLSVQIDTLVRENILVVAKGRDRLPSFSLSGHGTNTFTNLDNGLSMMRRFSIRDKDLVTVDNGDGTFTLTVLATGGETWFGPDGRLLFRNPGQVRYQLLIDNGGTPTDPSDDEVIEDLGIIKGSTGRNDTEDRDFCEDLNTYIG